MIGVHCEKNEMGVVEEFFQLFKTPWEFYVRTHSYDVVISSRDEVPEEGGKLLVIYGSKERRFDYKESIMTQSLLGGLSLEYDGITIPIYGNLLAFREMRKSLIRVKDGSEVVGLRCEKPPRQIIRVGFDLFLEVAFLLSKGQPPENAQIPTLERHIAMLRSWILEARIPLVEIPPVPANYNFAVCLTHDVDFVGIKRHKFDHTLMGFLIRAIITSSYKFLTNKLSFRKVLSNFKAVFSLPLVYLGFIDDFWIQFHRYAEIEDQLKSTYFVIPYKHRSGCKINFRHPERRAAKYDVGDIGNLIEKLLRNGHEIALHAIDAWVDPEMGKKELKRISEITGKNRLGTRTHWLLRDERTFEVLGEAGFFYDSTYGYNDAIGYCGGTTQVFHPIDSKALLELPLHIQDTALFRSKRMNLREGEAWRLCEELVKNVSLYGGVLTILWHHRSLAPERLWDDFYIKFLEKLRTLKVWFGTAEQIVTWFQRRRLLKFLHAEFSNNILELKLSNYELDDLPFLKVRVYLHENRNTEEKLVSPQRISYIEFPLDGDTELQFRPDI